MKTKEEISQSFKVIKETKDLINISFLEAQSDPETNTLQAKMVEDEVINILNPDPSKKFNLLVDVNSVGAINYLSPQAQSIYSSMAKLSQLKKTAVIGNNTFLEVIVNLIMQTAGKTYSFHWFKTREEALSWLDKD